jgi:hypothetical protein
MIRGKVTLDIPKHLLEDPAFQVRMAPRLMILAERLAHIIKRVAPKDTGLLRNSIQSEGPELTLGETEARVVSQVFHGKLMDEGREPGPVSKEGIGRIAQWASRKGIDDPERAAFAIAKKIRRRGIRPKQRFMTDTIESLRGPLEKRMALAAGESLKEWIEGR